MFPAYSSVAMGALFLLVSSGPALRADSELINNGNFNSGTAAWTLDHIKNAKGSFKVESIAGGNMAAHVVVPEAAAEAYYVQLFQGKLKLDAGETYCVHFLARGKPAVQISVNLMVAEAPWTNLWTQTITLTPEWQDFSFDVTTAQSAANARVTFSRLAAQTGDFWFTDITLTHVTPAK